MSFRFTQGPKILVDFGNLILDELEGATVRPGASIRLSKSPGGQLLDVIATATSGAMAWPFKIYNTTVTTTGQVQVNGGDGFVASLNGFVADVNGTPNDTKIGMPPAYPQLAVSGNGVIYGYAVPATPGTSAPLASLDVYYAGSLPSPDTSNPQGYIPFLIATVTGYAVDGSGNVSFNLANATNYGWTTLIYCSGNIQIY